MKTKLNITLCALLFTALVSCSTGRYASAQYDANEDTYSNSNQDAYSNSPDDYDNNSYDNYNNNDYYDNGSSGVSIDVFVDQLSPYGRWITYPSYGQVWICNQAGFIPYYSNGHWVYTNVGWTWVSNYNWGWAPFHYGRWAYDPFYGWMWVPGYEWGPAWVGWRTGGDYYGWAPLAPGINISLGFSWGNYMPADRWCFVPRRYIADPHFGGYVVDRGRNLTIINNTTIIKNTNVYHNAKYIAGPSRTEVERFTGSRINTIRINNETRPGNTRIADNRTITMYRPQIKKDDRLTPERISADRVRSLQSQSNRSQNVPSQQNRNLQPQQNHNLPQQKKEDIRIPQRNEVPPAGEHRPDINDRIDNNVPNIRRNDNNISDNRRGEQMNMQPQSNRNDRFNQQDKINQERINQQRINQEKINQERTNQERINQERINQGRINQERIDQERINQQRISEEREIQKRMNQQKNNDSYQNRSNSNVKQQPVTREWQPVQQMPQRRIQGQSENQYQPYYKGERRRS